MKNQILLYFLLLLAFIGGSLYNFRIRKQCIYSVQFTKSNIIVLIIATLIFFTIAYIYANSWYNYILVLFASMLLISGVSGEGINERGIYYCYGRGVLVRLAKWEDIKDIKIDINKNRLKSFKMDTLTIFVNQYYSLDDIEKINKYIRK